MKRQSASTGKRSTVPSKTTPEIRAARIRRAVLLLGAAIVGLLIAATGHMEATASTLVPPCPTNAWFGLYCPACGSTRAVMRLFHADFLGALHHNPATILALPLLAYFFIMGTDLTTLKWQRWQVAVLILVILAYSVLRNLPFWPWTLMVPPR